jgi:hypothetical protein
MNMQIRFWTRAQGRRKSMDARSERNQTMPQTRRLTILIVLATLVTALAACGGAPAAQSSDNATTAAPAASTAASAPTAEPVVTATSAAAPQVSAFTDHPNDATQARLRLAHFDLAGPNVDLYVNGAVAVNGGQPQVNIPSGNVNGYLFLAPATYNVAVVPTGKGIDQALFGPLDVSLVAGHRYTLALLRQLKDNTFKPLVIDETAAEQQLGAKPTDIVRIMVNNVAGVDGIDVEAAGKRISTNIPYGGFAIWIYPAGQPAEDAGWNTARSLVHESVGRQADHQPHFRRGPACQWA